MNWYLQTERMDLRQLGPDDEENLFDLDQDPEVMRFLSGGIPSSREQVRAAVIRIEGLFQRYQGRFGLWAAIERGSGEFMGWFLFRPCKKDPDNVERIELGYRLKQKFWKKGYATEGSQAIIAKGFQELSLKEIFAETAKSNLSSQNVMKKVGLTFAKEYFDPEFAFLKENIVMYVISRENFFMNAKKKS